MPLPYHSHPLFEIRKFQMVIAGIGTVLCALSIDYYRPTMLAPSIFFLALSLILCCADLILFAVWKAQNPDEEAKWPKKKWIAVDLVLAAFLQYIFWETTRMFEYNGVRIVYGAYGLMADFICSLLHAYACWKQIKERQRQHLAVLLERLPWSNCGHRFRARGQPLQLPLDTEGIQNPNPHVRQQNTSHNTPTQSSCCRVLTPEPTESAIEEGLLLGADFASSYGTIPDPDPVCNIDNQQEIIVGKGKQKKKGKAPILPQSPIDARHERIGHACPSNAV